MKSMAIVGIVLVILGVLSFAVPIPHREDHDVKIGSAKIGVQTDDSRKIPTAASVVLVGAGIVVLALGSRKA